MNRRLKKKETELNARRDALETEEEKLNFNIEEFEKEFFENTPLHEIPEEIQDDVDNDCEFEWATKYKLPKKKILDFNIKKSNHHDDVLIFKFII